MADSRRKVITLCGSTRFKEQFNDANFWLTINGHVVLSLGSFLHSDDDPAIHDIVAARRAQLDELHKYKIDMSDAIMVIDVNGYAGESTRSEVEHAVRKGKPVYSYTQSKKAAPALSVLVHCDPDVVESWLTVATTTPPASGDNNGNGRSRGVAGDATTATTAHQSLPNHVHYTRTSVPVPVTASKPRPTPSCHLAAAKPVAPSSSGSIAGHQTTSSNAAMAAPQAPPPYSTANMCRHCLHHANCHYIDEKYGDTYCTACANTKCRKLSDFIESDESETGVRKA